MCLTFIDMFRVQKVLFCKFAPPCNNPVLFNTYLIHSEENFWTTFEVYYKQIHTLGVWIKFLDQLNKGALL